MLQEHLSNQYIQGNETAIASQAAVASETTPCTDVSTWRADNDSNYYADKACHHLTEIVVANNAISYDLIIAPILNSLSSSPQNRWITWITDCSQTRAAIRLSPNKLPSLRTIDAANKEDLLWITWEALAQGNSQLVVCQTRFLSIKQKQLLDEAARIGQCQALVIRCINDTQWT